MADKEFNDKVVIITGSSGGIGKATAIKFAELGAKVVINGRNEERLLSLSKELGELSQNILSVCADVSKPADAKRLISDTIAKYGKIDILINNAGVSMRGDFADLDPEVYQKVFETNVFGITNLSIPAMKHLRNSKGSLVFISSVAGIRGLPGLSAYCSSKLSLRAIAESVRIEEAKSGIHVGLVQVGITEVDHDKKTIAADGSLISLEDRAKFKVQTTDYVAEQIIRNIRKRKFITTLTPIGKVNAVMQKLFPGLVEKILIRSVHKIKVRSK